MLVKAVQPRLSSAVTPALSALLLTFMAAGCGLLPESEPTDPLSNPKFLTPVAEAEEAGVKLYWLGRQFKAGSLSFGVSSATEFIVLRDGPGLEISYIADVEGGHVGFDVESYSGRQGGAAVIRERALSVRGTTSQRVRIGNWSGELFSIPSGTRPVNNLWLFVDLGDTIVVGQAGSGGPGIPGEDANPLIEADLLIDLMAQIRPYPQ